MALASYRSFRSFRAASANAVHWEDIDLRPSDEAEAAREARVQRAVFRKLLPPLFALSLVCYLDRTNISYAALQMNRDLGFTPEVYGIGTSIFFVGYILFEVPSNMLLYRVGAPKQLARIMVAWGIVAASMAAITNEAAFYTLRVLLGIAEAGAYPGMAFYLCQWVAERDFGVAWVAVIAGSPCSGILGGFLAAVILQLDGVAGLAGWRWLFLLEGLVPVGFGLALPFLLPLDPGQAKFLSADDAAWLGERQRKEEQERRAASRAEGLHALKAALTNPKVWWAASILATKACAYFGLIFFGPLVIESLISPDCALGARPDLCPEKTDVKVLLLSSIPYSFALAFSLLNSWHSRKTREKKLHSIVPMAVSALGLLLAPFVRGLPALGFVCVVAGVAGVISAMAAVSTLWAHLDAGEAHACSFAVINSGGSVGGLIGPLIIGSLTTSTGNFGPAFWVLAGIMAVSCALVALWPTKGHTRLPAGLALTSLGSVDFGNL